MGCDWRGGREFVIFTFSCCFFGPTTVPHALPSGKTVFKRSFFIFWPRLVLPYLRLIPNQLYFYSANLCRSTVAHGHLILHRALSVQMCFVYAKLVTQGGSMGPPIDKIFEFTFKCLWVWIRIWIWICFAISIRMLSWSCLAVPKSPKALKPICAQKLNDTDYVSWNFRFGLPR